MRIVNLPMRVVLGLSLPTPLGSGLMLVHLTGRRPDEDLLGVLATGNPRAARFILIPRDSSGHFDHAALENAVAHGFRMVRWLPF